MAMVNADERLQAMLNGKMKLIYIVGAHNGLRVSDVIGLKVRCLRIREPTVRERKTNKSKRIYIPQKARTELIKMCKGLPDNAYVFHNSKNIYKPISRQAVYKAFKVAESKLGNDVRVGTHSMRKAYAQKLLRKGKSYKVIQGKLNHSSLSDTLRYLININD